jgi:hypothetical protein
MAAQPKRHGKNNPFANQLCFSCPMHSTRLS